MAYIYICMYNINVHTINVYTIKYTANVNTIKYIINISTIKYTINVNTTKDTIFVNVLCVLSLWMCCAYNHKMKNNPMILIRNSLCGTFYIKFFIRPSYLQLNYSRITLTNSQTNAFFEDSDNMAVAQGKAVKLQE